MNPHFHLDTLFEDEATLPEDVVTEPFVPVYRAASSPWSELKRPMILSPRADDLDFEAAIDSLTTTALLEEDELLEWA